MRFASMLVVAALLFVAVRMIMPDIIREEDFDLPTHFKHARRPFFTSVALIWSYGLVWRTVFFGEALFVPRRSLQAGIAVLAVSGVVLRARRAHWAIAVATVFLWLALVGLFRFRLGSG